MASAAEALLPSQSERLSPIERAAWLIEDAMQAIPPTNRTHMCTSARRAYLHYWKVATPGLELVVALLVVLTFFEMPLWCVHRVSWWTTMSADLACAAPNHSQIYLSGLPYLPVGWGCSLETGLYAFLLYLAYADYRWRVATGERFTSRVGMARSLLAMLASLDVFIFCLCSWLGVVPLVRLAPYARLLLVVCSRRMLPIVASTCDLLSPFCSVLSLLVGLFVAFGWVFAMLLDDVTAKVPGCVGEYGCADANAYFFSLRQALYTMMVASTNADVPDMVTGTLAFNRAFGLLWMAFYLSTNMLGLNLVLAVVYNEYAESLKSRIVTFFRCRADGIKQAYLTMDEVGVPDGTVSRADVMELVAELNKCPVCPNVPPQHTKYLYGALDDDQSGELTLREFYDICDVMQYAFKRVRTQSYLEHTCPVAWGALGLRRLKVWVEINLNDWATAVMTVNALVILVESVTDLQDMAILSPSAWETVDFCFSMLYVVQLLLVLVAVPLDSYLISLGNRFDLITTLVLAVVALVDQTSHFEVHQETLRYLNILRVLRLAAKLGRIPRYTALFKAINRFISGSLPVLVLTSVVIGLWAVLGVQYFGGQMYRQNPQLANCNNTAIPAGCDVLDDNYDVLNMNDFAMASFTLLTMLVAGGPIHQLVDGYTATSGSPFWTTAYFMSFVYIGFLAIFNVFSAFVIDAFLLQFDPEDVETQSDEVEELATNESGYRVIISAHGRLDRFYRDMFEDELEEVNDEGQ